MAAEASAEERLVIPLRSPPLMRLLFALLSFGSGVGLVVWIVRSHSGVSIVEGGLGIGILIWGWGTLLAARRARGGAPLQIVATREGISTPLWSINWDQVKRIWIGPMPSRLLRGLHIEPKRPTDIVWASARVLKFNTRLGDAMKMAPIQIPQTGFDRPLEEILRDLEGIAGRPLG